MTANIYAIAFILPGKIQMESRLKELLDRYDTSNEFEKDFGLYPYLDIAPIFLASGATVAAAPVAGSEDHVFAYQVLIHEGTEDDFYSIMEDVLDEMFLPKEAPTPVQKSTRAKFQVLEGGRV